MRFTSAARHRAVHFYSIIWPAGHGISRPAMQEVTPKKDTLSVHLSVSAGRCHLPSRGGFGAIRRRCTKDTASSPIGHSEEQLRRRILSELYKIQNWGRQPGLYAAFPMVVFVFAELKILRFAQNDSCGTPDTSHNTVLRTCSRFHPARQHVAGRCTAIALSGRQVTEPSVLQCRRLRLSRTLSRFTSPSALGAATSPQGEALGHPPQQCVTRRCTLLHYPASNSRNLPSCNAGGYA